MFFHHNTNSQQISTFCCSLKEINFECNRKEDNTGHIRVLLCPYYSYKFYQ